MNTSVTLRIVHHLLFWCALWLLMSLSNGLYDYDFKTVGLYNLCRLSFTMLPVYLLVYLILPRYFKGNKFEAVVLGMLVLLAAVLLDRLLIQFLLFPLFYAGSEYTFVYWDWYRLSSFFVHVLTTTGAMAGFKYYRDWQRAQRRVEELADEQRRAELQFLRAQTHPHFLFNMLNALYYETGKDVQKAQELILQFSDFLRFTLHESTEEWIDITREEALIRNYVALQKSRFGERVSVEITWEVEGSEKLPPMLCFFLVENAYKHGTMEARGDGSIRIAMRRTKNQLEFRVENTLAEEKAADPLQSREGIGLRNLRRQLDLLYDTRYTYLVERKGGYYCCTLQIPLMP